MVYGFVVNDQKTIVGFGKSIKRYGRILLIMPFQVKFQWSANFRSEYFC